MMAGDKRQVWIGIGAIGIAGFLFLIAIPEWIASPSNIRNIILSPLFWPYAIAGMTALAGVGLIGTGLRARPRPLRDEDTPPGAYHRLALVAVLMVFCMFGLPRLGMVWTSMLAFAALAFLVKTKHPRTAILAAIAVPLLLYAFFAHVAGVAIPQGLLVRLP